ncbi:MAG: HD domain-containing protein [bacterium]|nr:HD domain-containing protein [bacterium]
MDKAQGCSQLDPEIAQEIIENNQQREEKTLSPYACKSSSGIRQEPEREKIADPLNIRPVFFHDTDKIIHSLAYSRYIDKTQVFFLFENDHITHRVLHVQFVSKIARVIGRCLRLNEDLIEAIALGHDIGHAPYGHDGESYLDQLCLRHGIGHFYHNLQGVRLLREIENRGHGLNISLQVLDGIMCHNGEIESQILRPDYHKTWDSFLEDYQRGMAEKEFCRKFRPMTLEGMVVRIADIIAYIGRDIEDAITVKLIRREDIPSRVVKVLGNRNDTIINALVLDLIENSFDKDYLCLSSQMFEALEDLKEFNYRAIYLNPRIKSQNSKIERMFELLFDTYLRDLKEERTSSPIYKFFLDQMDPVYFTTTSSERMVVDFISGMTDEFFNRQFRESFFPASFGLEIE